MMSSFNNKIEQQLMGNKMNQKSSLKAVFKNVHVYRESMGRAGYNSLGYGDQTFDQCLSINYVLKEKKQKSWPLFSFNKFKAVSSNF